MAADLPRRRHEVLGIVAAASAILLGLALASYDARSVDNLAGPVGAGVAGTFLGRWITGKLPEAGYVRVIQWMLLILSVILLGRGGHELLVG